MYLPDLIQKCISALEDAGFAAYAVGGCVRDSLLGLTPHDYDLCTNALPQQTKAVFRDYRLVLAGEKHGTVTVVTPEGNVEITTFRTEGGYRDSRHPDWVKFVPDIEGDLARRDFTVNAMAYSPTRDFADPFGGQADLQSHILRAVGNPQTRFREDALRILRGVRFSAKYGLTPENATLNAMVSESHLLDSLARERVFEELGKYLLVAKTEDLCRFAPILGAAIPELSPMIGFDQHSPHHAYDVYTHICHVTAATPALPILLRWAALLHDVGKPACFTQDETGRGHFKGHAQVGAQMAEEIFTRLHAPKGLREDAVWLIDHHMTPLENDEAQLRRYLSRYGCPRLCSLILLERADMMSKGICDNAAAPRFDAIQETLDQLNAAENRLTPSALAVDGNDIKALGFEGREIGAILKELLEKVLDGTLENNQESLIAYAKARRKEAMQCLTTPTKL